MTSDVLLLDRSPEVVKLTAVVVASCTSLAEVEVVSARDTEDEV